MDTISIKQDDGNYLMIDDYNNGRLSPINSTSSINKRNLSPNMDDDQINQRTRSNKRSRSRSYEDRERNHNYHRSRSPRSRDNRSNRDSSRDRYRRSENTGRSSRPSDRGGDSKYRWEKTVYVSNIPYDVKWTELKDLFRAKVNVEPMYCELFEKDGKSLGVGSIEFKNVNDAEKAVEVMHQYELGGRRISVRIDGEGYKTKQAREMAGDSYNSSSSNRHSSNNSYDQNQPPNADPSSTAAALLASTLASSLTSQSGPNLLSLLGLANPLLSASSTSPTLTTNLLGSNSGGNLLNQNALLNQMAAQLKVEGPVTNRLFVASLDYKVDEQKIKEVFNLAGHVTNVSLFKDRDGKSRGMAVVEYDSPFEALNAVSMFNKQTLMDRQMTVRFDTKPPTKEEEMSRDKSLMSGGGQSKLPSGLKSIGNSLGLNLLGTGGSPITPNPLSLSALTGLAGADLGLNVNSNGLGNFGTQSVGLNQSSTNGGRSSSGSSSNQISKIFVKNIPFSWDERKLKEKFRQAGSIEFADIKIKDGKSRGCGLIRFATPEQAQKAVELFNGSRFEGRTLDVKLDLY